MNVEEEELWQVILRLYRALDTPDRSECDLHITSALALLSSLMEEEENET